MRAVVIEGRGGPETLTVSSVPEPSPGPGQVVIDVAGAGLNRADLLQTQGMHPPPDGAPAWPGLEASGVIGAVGPDVTDWSVGDRVCALLDGGGYAERVVAPVGMLLPVPDGVDLVDAAALPEALCTVWSNLTGPGGLDAESLDGAAALVHGGSGGIGTTAIQLLRAFGARVFTTAGGAERAARCAELGAEVAIDYREDDFGSVVLAATDGQGVQVILDVVGAKYLEQNLATLARHGRLVVVGLQKGRTAELDLAALMQGWKSVHGTVLRARPAAEKAEIVARVRRDLWPLVESGAIAPVIHARVPLDQARAAQEQLAAGEVFGKVVLVP